MSDQNRRIFGYVNITSPLSDRLEEFAVMRREEGQGEREEGGGGGEPPAYIEVMAVFVRA